MLRGVSQRLSEGERGWEGEKRGLEGQCSRALHSLRESQAAADQLRSASTPLCWVFHLGCTSSFFLSLRLVLH